MVEEIFELGNIDVSESALKPKEMGRSLGSIRGRQATVNALIGNEHDPTIRLLRFLIDYQSERPSSSEHNPKIGHSTYLHT